MGILIQQSSDFHGLLREELHVLCPDTVFRQILRNSQPSAQQLHIFHKALRLFFPTPLCLWQHKVCKLSILLPAVRQVDLQHLRKQNCVADAMGNMELSPKGIGQSVHSYRSGGGEAHPRNKRTQQHVFPCLPIKAVLTGPFYVGDNQRRRIAGKHPAEEIGLFRQIGFYRMTKRVHPGGSRKIPGKSQGKRRIQHTIGCCKLR